MSQPLYRRHRGLPVHYLDNRRVVYTDVQEDVGGGLPGAYQRETVYRKERRIKETRQDLWILWSIEEVRNYAAAVLTRAEARYSRAGWPVQFTEVDVSVGVATYLGGEIRLPVPILQFTVLHELGHHLAGQDAGHNEDFMQAFIYLVRMEMGDEVADQLE